MSKTIVVKAREVFRGNNFKPPKPKAWSHDDELKAHKGRLITLFFFAGELEFVTGVLVDSDRFSVKLAVHLGDATQSVLTVFYKHVITSYQLLDA